MKTEATEAARPERLVEARALVEGADAISAEAKAEAKRLEEEYQAMTGSARMTPELRARIEKRQADQRASNAETGSASAGDQLKTEEDLTRSGDNSLRTQVATGRGRGGARRLSVESSEKPKDAAKAGEQAKNESRKDVIASIREAGIEIKDDATDAEIEAALQKMEEQA